MIRPTGRLLLMCAVAILLAGCGNLVRIERNYQSNTAWAASQQARIIAAGTITDPAGHPLNEVELIAHYTYLRPTVEDLPRALTIRECRSEAVNKTFRMIFSYATDAHLTFRKPGYREKTIDLAVQPSKGIEDSIDRYPKASELLAEHLQVILEPLPPTTQEFAPGH